ncbi:nucleotidyl transferase AbiEii/AbiGii toxin family protein [Hespellia stercorisuis]|uniref:Predicted nucleotidyltransferase component of viral defense system n=1 Tax=Hespellia stercorisuis DSM 15480 TaxID=1121950 RepID=A0A1M6RZG6_9FIRM|nr:nucleotidyl transferase AbiEii/AbiGii toxin family protein [Hespellia stercorisuis]SHK37707.1 Predicted nucleotidyltransferase component of viral defense system [Hespellia stercorisuis DSM 15480]
MNVNSVKDRLKNFAKETGKTMQDALVLYGLERALYRLSISEYAERFTLKGGIFLYALFDGEYARATTDIDLLAQHIPNDAEKMKVVFTDIFSIDCDDTLRYDLGTLDVQNITEFKEYHGVKVTVMAYLDRTKIPVSIDIGFGDVIYPERVQIDFPTILEMDAPKLYGYTLVTAIAEKFEAFVNLGLANSRYKDFYDIYVLVTRYDIDGNMLQHAIMETFEHRATTFEDIVAFDNDFAADRIRQSRWKAFIKKKKAMINVELQETLDVVMNFLAPVIDSIENHENYEAHWGKEELSWHK